MSRKSTRQVGGAQHTGFALKLREALAEDGRTVEQFSRDIDRTLRTVQRWRRGESTPSAPDLVLLARELDRKPEWFYPEDREAA